MTRWSFLRIGLLSAIGVALVVPVLWAQSAASRAPSATDSALLEEVRALRVELGQASGASLRAQLLVARVQLQEQRIIYLDRRRAEAATRASDAAEKSRLAAVRVNELEEQQRRFRSNAVQIPKQDFEAMSTQIGFEIDKARSDAAAALGLEQQARTEESDLAGALAAEQGRWTEFSARLNDLERALPK
jgi:hypothetical protein